MGHIGPPGPLGAKRKQGRGATRSRLATKIAAVKWVNIKEGWYKAEIAAQFRRD